MGQQLHALLHRLGHKGAHRFIRVDRIPPIAVLRPFVGLSHPGGAPLGRAVQKQLPAPHAQPAHAGFALRVQLRAGLDVRIAHHIELQPPFPGIFLQQGIFPAPGQPVLRQRYAVGQIGLLGQIHPPELLRLGGGRDPCLAAGEGGLLQIPVRLSAGPPADAAALRIRRFRLHAQGAERGRIAHRHMPGCVGDQNRNHVRHPVQIPPGGPPAVGVSALVIAEAHQPFPVCGGRSLQPLCQPPADRVCTFCPGKRRQAHGLRQSGDVAVGVDKRREQGGALQIDPFRIRILAAQAVERAHCHNGACVCTHRLRGSHVLHSDDRAVAIYPFDRCPPPFQCAAAPQMEHNPPDSIMLY